MRPGDTLSGINFKKKKSHIRKLRTRGKQRLALRTASSHVWALACSKQTSVRKALDFRLRRVGLNLVQVNMWMQHTHAALIAYTCPSCESKQVVMLLRTVGSFSGKKEQPPPSFSCPKSISHVLKDHSGINRSSHTRTASAFNTDLAWWWLLL